MSSIKKNILAVALVAGLGIAGGAAAYNYGTSTKLTPQLGTVLDLATEENVAIQQILNESTVYVMQEDIQFVINEQDAILGRTTGFSFRLRLLDFGAKFACTPKNVEGVLVSAPILNPVCLTSQLVKGDQEALQDWDFIVESGGAGTDFVVIKAVPRIANPRGLPSGVLIGIRNANITNIGELRTEGLVVRGEFKIVEPVGGADPYPLTLKIVPLLKSVDVFACKDFLGGDTDKYIDVADHWESPMVPKSRFSFDGKLGSSMGQNSADSQYIDFGNLQINVGNNPANSFTFMTNDVFKTTLNGGANDDFDAFYNGPQIKDDDIFFVAAGQTCSSGAVAPLVRSTITKGSAVAVFDYTWGQIGGVDGQKSISVKVCGYVNTDLVIDDTLITHTTNYLFRGDLAISQGNAIKTCDVLPLRNNGSTMEIFYINPGSNVGQESFIRLTNRSAPRDVVKGGLNGRSEGGWVRLEGIDDGGNKAATQASVFVPAGGSVQVSSKELENGTGKVVGGWGKGAGKWRAVVTAEFPGLVAASFVRNVTGQIVTNVTDSDTRGEQAFRDTEEGKVFNKPGSRPSDYFQETTPDFHGDGEADGPLGGPNDGLVPTGGSTDPNVPDPSGSNPNQPGNPGLGGI